MIAVLMVFLLTNIRPMLKAGAPDLLVDAALDAATQHQRDPELHRLGMLRRWGPKWLSTTESDQRIVAGRLGGNAICPVRRHSSYVAIRAKTRSLLVPVVQAAPIVTAMVLPIARQPLAAPFARQPLAASFRDAPVQAVSMLQKTANGDVHPFHEVVVGPKVELTLRVGSNQGYSVNCPGGDRHEMAGQQVGDQLEFRVDGGSGPLKVVTARVENGVLFLSGAEPVAVVATTPTLDGLQVSGESTVNCSGISDRAFKVVESGHSTVAIDGQALDLHMDLSGNSVLRGVNLSAGRLEARVSGGSAMEFGGEFAHLDLRAEAGSSLRAQGHVCRLDVTGDTGSAVDCSSLTARDVGVDATSGAQMRVCATKSLIANATLSSRIEYSGNPKNVNATPDGTSKIFL